ncbi:DUF6262 family protein [Nonomuraea angiospora]
MTIKTPPDRTAQAVKARRQHSNALLNRVRDAIAELHKDHARITKSAIVRRSGVSGTFLNQNAEARALAEAAVARADGHHAQRRQQAVGHINASWPERAINAEQGLKQATAEIHT